MKRIVIIFLSFRLICLKFHNVIGKRRSKTFPKSRFLMFYNFRKPSFSILYAINQSLSCTFPPDSFVKVRTTETNINPQIGPGNLRDKFFARHAIREFVGSASALHLVTCCTGHIIISLCKIHTNAEHCLGNNVCSKM